MFIKLVKSKLHGAKVTDTRLHYQGSIAIDPELMEAADIMPYETVLIADVDNGNRLQTYAIPAESNSGDIIILGAAARLIKKGDEIIVFSFCYCTGAEAKELKPKVVTFNQGNKIKQVKQK